MSQDQDSLFWYEQGGAVTVADNRMAMEALDALKIQAISCGLTTCASLPSLLSSIFLLKSQWVYKIVIYLDL